MPCNVDLKQYYQYLRICGHKIEHLDLTLDENDERTEECTSKLFLVVAMHCHNLKVLAIQNIVVTESLGIQLCNCPLLVELILRGCTGLIAKTFRNAELPLLKALSVAASDCDDPCLLVLVQKSMHICCLDLSGAWDLSNAGIVRALSTCPGLEKLGLHNLDVTDDIVSEVVLNCPQIQELDIGGCADLTDISIMAVVQHAKQLEALLMGGSDNFTDAALDAVAEHCPHTTWLDLQDSTNLTTPGFSRLLEKCTKIIGLSLDLATVSLVEAFPTQLELLILAKCEISDDLLVALSIRCKHLTELTFTCHCNGTFTEHGIAALAWGCPRLKELLSCTEIPPAVDAVWRTCRPDLQVVKDNSRYNMEIFFPGMTVK